MKYNAEQMAQRAVMELWALAIDQEALGTYAEGEHGHTAIGYLRGEATEGDELRCKLEEIYMDYSATGSEWDEAWARAQALTRKLADTLEA